jgi:hypothetical protein
MEDPTDRIDDSMQRMCGPIHGRDHPAWPMDDPMHGIAHRSHRVEDPLHQMAGSIQRTAHLMHGSRMGDSWPDDNLRPPQGVIPNARTRTPFFAAKTATPASDIVPAPPPAVQISCRVPRAGRLFVHRCSPPHRPQLPLTPRITRAKLGWRED